MLWIILGIAAIVFAIYSLIPSYWARNYSSKVLRKGAPDKKWIALTFDDGPNPHYTPLLLDILKKYKIPATFFLTGKYAALNPELVKRIGVEGHLVDCHSYFHHHAWLMPPFMTYMDMVKTCEIIEKILGQAPRWYRPPWGTFNLFSIIASRKLKLYPAYWSIEAQDWEAKTTVEHIRNTVLSQAEPGSIIVLHDNRGANGAPEKTLKALPSIIEALQNQGYKFVSLDEMKGATPCSR